MSRRMSLVDLSWEVIACLDEYTWKTPSQCAEELGLGHGFDYYRVALSLERLANDGYAELKQPGSRVRRFRLRGEPAP